MCIRDSCLDVGTNNKKLARDELYMGNKFSRIRGKQYDEFVDKFIQAVKKLYPNAVLHFEDFGVKNARRILERYRNELSCFNDDIQGTGAAVSYTHLDVYKRQRLNIWLLPLSIAQYLQSLSMYCYPYLVSLRLPILGLNR